jgi:hypothetical protein
MKRGVLAGIHENIVRLKQTLQVLRRTGCEVLEWTLPLGFL